MSEQEQILSRNPHSRGGQSWKPPGAGGQWVPGAVSREHSPAVVRMSPEWTQSSEEITNVDFLT